MKFMKLTAYYETYGISADFNTKIMYIILSLIFILVYFLML